ncbi:hypothetical protein ACIBW9_26625 [Streptomyces sp. NPDC049541]|uniref:hypothetical protein n=1 Tax=Streptomyces sp. NPDC049541 TaxID=3365594 RepID=UPI0037AAD41F
MTLPGLDGLIAEVDRTCATAHRPGDQEQPDWLALRTAAAAISGRLQALDLVEDYVEHCRMHGVSWTHFGSALGVTRRAVRQRGLTAEEEQRHPAAAEVRRVGGGRPPVGRRPAEHGRLTGGRADRLAPYSRKAIAPAEARVKQAGSQLIDCADLLVGLAQVGRGVASVVLAEKGFGERQS